jgi:hypothetical protein
MSSSDKEKIDELLLKLKTLGDRAKTTRAQFGSPLVDRLFDRVDKLSSRLPQGNGDSRSQQQPPQQPPLKVCPKCGKTYFEDVSFCTCGFSFEGEKRRQERAEEERERLERASKMGVIS